MVVTRTLSGGTVERKTARYPARNAAGQPDVIVHTYQVTTEPGIAPVTKPKEWRLESTGEFVYPKADAFETSAGETWTLISSPQS